MDSLRASDDLSAAVAVAPRVSLDDIKASIRCWEFFTADEIVDVWAKRGIVFGDAKTLSVLTVCLMIMRNGFIVIGKSAPASPENFNADVGKTFAYEDCIRQLWPLMGFCLRDKLHNGQT